MQIDAPSGKPPEKKLMQVEDFLAEYNIGRNKFYDEVRKGKLIIRKLGKRTYVKREDAIAWVNSLESKPL